MIFINHTCEPLIKECSLSWGWENQQHVPDWISELQWLLSASQSPLFDCKCPQWLFRPVSFTNFESRSRHNLFFSFCVFGSREDAPKEWHIKNVVWSESDRWWVLAFVPMLQWVLLLGGYTLHVGNVNCCGQRVNYDRVCLKMVATFLHKQHSPLKCDFTTPPIKRCSLFSLLLLLVLWLE